MDAPQGSEEAVRLARRGVPRMYDIQADGFRDVTQADVNGWVSACTAMCRRLRELGDKPPFGQS